MGLGLGGITHASGFLMLGGLWRSGTKPNLPLQATKDEAGSCETLTCLVSAMCLEQLTPERIAS